ncbi:MAG: hypothetical protein QOD36_1319 [Mycobacterium sp.]|nr:hypothetical protein [Mycobacterium sp.]MDT5333210.1 hypothetical protein [Mycobacterium sp.]
MLHAQREQVTHDYAHILANDLFSADAILEAILNGPSSERLFTAIEEISAAIDAEAAQTLDVENLIAEKINKLTPEQYESILRPVFKDDEMLMVTVGAVLGFWVGELQVFFVEHFAR